MSGQSQYEMNANSAEKYTTADNELNTVYQKILKSYSEDTLYIKKQKITQQLWIQLRDAEVEARYLPGGFYGSVEPMCRFAILTDLTKQRTKHLKLWLDGIEHQDACKGTVREKE